MGRKALFFVLAATLTFCSLAFGDFKYTETTQMTGGAMAGMMKGLGVFSKSARQVTKGMDITTYVKGNYLRNDNSDGSYRIIDLDGKRIIDVKPANQTYSVTTFDEMRQFMERMQQAFHQAAQKQNQQPAQQGQMTNVTMTPKIEVTPTGKTQTILGQDTQELIVKVGLQMQGTDAQGQTHSGTMSTEMDDWLAPSVIGYHEVTDFYKKMALAIGWTPNSTPGMDPRMANSMAELYKSGKIPVGLPMLSTISLLAECSPGDQACSQQQAQQQQQQQSSTSPLEMATPGGVAAKALGGMFSRRRKKQQQEDAQQNASEPQTTVPPNSLMTLTSRVSSYSTDPIDAGLFQIPSGYTQVQSDIERGSQRSSR